jgi:transcriptional regulator with XRE-family HTH domain
MKRQAEHVGSVIRAARLERGWTQARLHIAAGVNLADVSLIETGRLRPSQNQLRKITDALNLRPEDVDPR